MIESIRWMASSTVFAALATLAVGCSAATGAPDDQQGSTDTKKTWTLSPHGGEGEDGPGAVRTESLYGNTHGGTGGNDWVPGGCADGDGVTGLVLHTGTYVNEIELQCHGVAGASWGSGGNWAPGLYCNYDNKHAGWVVTGIIGHAHTYLDSLGIICRDPNDLSKYITVGPEGGGGGQSWGTDDCAWGGGILAGFNVKSGSWIDAIQPVCKL